MERYSEDKKLNEWLFYMERFVKVGKLKPDYRVLLMSFLLGIFEEGRQYEREISD